MDNGFEEGLAVESAALTLGNGQYSRMLTNVRLAVSANGINVLGASDTTTGGLDDNRREAYST